MAIYIDEKGRPVDSKPPIIKVVSPVGRDQGINITSNDKQQFTIDNRTLEQIETMRLEHEAILKAQLPYAARARLRALTMPASRKKRR